MTSGGPLACATILRDEQRAFYRANGYLVLPQLVPEGFLVGVQAILEDLGEEKISQWRRATLIRGTYAGLDFGSRYYRAWLAAGRPTRLTTADDEGAFRQALSDHVGQVWLRGLAAELSRTDRVTALESCFYRAKFPGDESTSLPWHQDAQCLARVAGLDFVTAWIPLVDVTEHTSCLEVSPVGEQEHLYEPAWSERSGYVCMRQPDADALPEVHPVPMRRGDVLVLSPYLPHRSLENTGPTIRWSVDLRYSAV